MARYSALRVSDAAGAPLPASIVQTDLDSFAILVEDAGALYPVLVDPTLVDTGYINSPQSNSSFGYSIAYCARQQGLYGGILVGAPSYDSGAYNAAGAAFYYPIDVTTLELPSSASWSFIGSHANEHVGWSVAAGKTLHQYSAQYGWNSLVIGAWGYTSGGAVNRGAVFVFYPNTQGDFSSTPSWTAIGWNGGVNLGWSVASAGDVDGDGYDEILVGGPGASSNGYSYKGRL